MEEKSKSAEPFEILSGMSLHWRELGIQPNDTSGWALGEEMQAVFQSGRSLISTVQELERAATVRALFSGSPDQQIRTRWMQTAQEFPRIQINLDIVNGEPRIANTRIPVSIILSSLAEGDSPQEIVEEFGSLDLEDIREALLFAARLTWLD